MTDYTKECWSCGSKEVFPIKDWYECTKCGATHVPQRKLGPPVVEPGNVFASPRDEKPEQRSKHPTAGVARQARLARKKKAGSADKEVVV